MIRTGKLVRALLACSLLGAVGCRYIDATKKAVFSNSTDSTAVTPTGQSANWDAYVQQFLNDYFKARPDVAVYQGKHEYDGQLPDWSEAGIANEIARLHAQRDKAAAFDTTGLDDPRLFQRQYVLAVIDKDLFWEEEAKWPSRNPAWYGDPLDPNVYVTRPYASQLVRMQAFTKWAQNVPNALTQIKAALHTPMPKPYIAIGRIRFGGLVSYLQNDVPEAFAEVKDSAARIAFDSARTNAANAFSDMDKWFAALEPTGTADFALGPDIYKKMLWMTERVDVPVDKLWDIGQADLERNRKALEEACKTYAPGQALLACMDKMNAHKPSQEPVAAATGQLTGLRDFIAKNDLASIPGTEQALVKESPPYQRWNFAYIDIPGPYEQGLPSVYYVSPPDPKWSKAERDAYVPGVAKLLFTSAHEVWPGHFLQFLHANRSPDIFGRVFVGYAFAEGWAHYSEEMMWEAGLGNGDVETHIGQISEAMLRDARFLSSIGMHTRGMTQLESATLFREKGMQDLPSAREQAARGTFDPAYLNYTLGKLMIRQLREDWTATRGGKAGWKQFHDAFLSYGGPPIPLVRNAMLGANAGPAIK